MYLYTNKYTYTYKPVYGYESEMTSHYIIMARNYFRMCVRNSGSEVDTFEYVCVGEVDTFEYVPLPDTLDTFEYVCVVTVTVTRSQVVCL
jgi:hypothetical protein